MRRQEIGPGDLLAMVGKQRRLPLRFYLIRMREGARLSKWQAATRLGAPADVYRAWEDGTSSRRTWEVGRVGKYLGERQGVTLHELEGARGRAAAAASSIVHNRNRLAAEALADQEADFDDIARMATEQMERNLRSRHSA